MSSDSPFSDVAEGVTKRFFGMEQRKYFCIYTETQE